MDKGGSVLTCQVSTLFLSLKKLFLLIEKLSLDFHHSKLVLSLLIEKLKISFHITKLVLFVLRMTNLVILREV